MLFSKKQFLAILAFAGVVAAVPLKAQKRSYQGTKVIRLDIISERDSDFVERVIDTLGLETWTEKIAPEHHADVVLSPTQVSKFFKMMAGSGIRQTVMHEDLETSIQQESSHSHLTSRQDNGWGPNPDWYNAYHPYDQHLAYLFSLIATYPNNAEVVFAGRSTQGRDIIGIHIWGKCKGKKAVVLHGTVHAREWISTKVVQYLALSLLQGSSSKSPTAPTNKYDYYIWPVVNPDGFVYSQEVDRMWRKNRLVDSTGCIGTDINRNWNYKWGNGGGASTNPCSDNFQGTSAGNTEEYKGLQSFIAGLVKTTGVKLFVDYHSYAQMILSPWGWTCTIDPPEVKEHMKMMTLWEAASRKRYGTAWTFGPACKTIYATTGDSTDYTYGALNITHSYGVELRDTGTYGFILPPDQIKPSCEEAWDGFSALIKALK